MYPKTLLLRVLGQGHLCLRRNLGFNDHYVVGDLYEFTIESQPVVVRCVDWFEIHDPNILCVLFRLANNDTRTV